MHEAPCKGTLVSKGAHSMPRHGGPSSSSKSLIHSPVANLVNSLGQRCQQAARSQSLASHGIPRTSWKGWPSLHSCFVCGHNLRARAGPSWAIAHELEHERRWLAA